MTTHADHPGTQRAPAGWAKSPTHLLREDALDRLTRDWQPDRFLELGAGTGTISAAFIGRGFEAFLSDIDTSTLDALRLRFSARADVTVIESIHEIAQHSMPYVFAFEVLEHIDDDLGALCAWTTKLKNGGRILVSVPAHQRKYGPSDLRVGHVRRYERAQLHALLRSAGLTSIDIRSYGFPLTALSRWVGNVVQRRSAVELHPDPVQRSIDSGQRQSPHVLSIARFVNRGTLFPFIVLHRIATLLGWGDGYVATGVLAREQVGQPCEKS